MTDAALDVEPRAHAGDAQQYGLTARQREVAALARRIATTAVADRAREIDATATYPEDIRRVIAANGLFGIVFDREHGGTADGALAQCLAVEELAKVCASSAHIIAVQDLGTLPIRLDGSSELRDRVLPRFAAGEHLAAFALSEPEAGSDPKATRTAARRVDGGWLLSGTKKWISSAGVADAYVVFAISDAEAAPSRGMTAFFVTADSPGFRVGRIEDKMGMRGTPTGELHFDDVFVADRDVVGAVGTGFKVAMRTFDHSRLAVAAQALGIAQGATDYAAAYARERTAFGRPINELQGIQFKLADLETQCAAGRELLYRAAAESERGGPGVGKFSAMAKLFCSDAAMAVTTEAVQVLGGYGYVRDHPVERMMRDAKLTQIYEGTNEIQRLVIGRSLR